MKLLQLSLLLSISILFTTNSLNAQNAECIKAYNAAVEKVKVKDYEGAVVEYGKAIAADPTYDKAYYNRGTANLRLKNYDAAANDFTKTVSITPEYAKAHYYQGYVKMKQKNYKDALVNFSKAIKHDPEIYDAYYYRGYIQMQDKNLEKAIEDFNEAAKLDPDNSKTHYNSGVFHYQLKNYIDAANSFTLAYDLNADYPKALYYRGMSFSKLEKYDKAIPDFTTYIEADPTVEGYYNRGLNHSKMDNADAAITDFKAALAIDPMHINSLKNVASIGVKSEDYPAAANAFSQLMKAEPKVESHYLNAGICHFNASSYGESLKSLDALIAMNPKHAEGLFNRSNSYAKLGQNAKACADVKSSAELGFDKAFQYVASYCQ